MTKNLSDLQLAERQLQQIENNEYFLECFIEEFYICSNSLLESLLEQSVVVLLWKMSEKWQSLEACNGNFGVTLHAFWLVGFVALRPKSTAMVIAGLQMFFGSKMYDTPERFFQQKTKKNMQKYRHGARWVQNYIGVRLKIGILLNICLNFTFHHFQFCIAVLKIMLNCKKGLISINNKIFF